MDMAIVDWPLAIAVPLQIVHCPIEDGEIARFPDFR